MSVDEVLAELQSERVRTPRRGRLGRLPGPLCTVNAPRSTARLSISTRRVEAAVTRLYLEDRRRLEMLSEKLKLRGSEGPAVLENAEVLSLLRMLKYVEDLAEFLASQEGLIADRRVSPHYDK